MRSLIVNNYSSFHIVKHFSLQIIYSNETGIHKIYFELMLSLVIVDI